MSLLNFGKLPSRILVSTRLMPAPRIFISTSSALMRRDVDGIDMQDVRAPKFMHTDRHHVDLPQQKKYLRRRIEDQLSISRHAVVIV